MEKTELITEIKQYNSDHYKKRQDIIKWLYQHPMYTVPLFSIWFYFVAVVYLDGYLKYFGARGEWFSPSIFQMIAFSRRALIYAILFITGLIVLREKSTIKNYQWGILFVTWMAIQLYPVYWLIHAWPDTQFLLKYRKVLGYALYILSWLFIPILWRYIDQKYLRDIERIEKLKSDLQSQKDKPEPGHEFIKDMDEQLNRMQQNLENCIERPITKQIETYFAIIIIVSFILYISYFGIVSAATRRQTVDRFISWEHILGEQRAILFTDGNNMLIREHDESGFQTIFVSGVTNTKFIVANGMDISNKVIKSLQELQELQSTMDQLKNDIEGISDRIKERSKLSEDNKNTGNDLEQLPLKKSNPDILINDN